ncbi:MAG: EscU/YscU/HrcU family type III secretion system export apparatus switch protein [Pseudomonadota bacterium]
MAEDALNSEEKTLPATPTRLRRLREQGQVPRSPEVGTAGVLVASALAFWVLGPGIVHSLAEFFASSLNQMGRPQPTPDIVLVLIDGMFQALAIIAPLLLIAFAAAFFTPMLLSGWVLSADPVTFKWERLDPIKGIKRRIFSTRGLLEMAKAMVKLTIIAAVTIGATYAVIGSSVLLDRHAMPSAIGSAGELALAVFALLCLGAIVIAAIDMPLQRFHFAREHRMSPSEVKRELRNEEGIPEVRSRIRQMQRELAERRMMDAVPTADVVITNPAHVAVALSYQSDRNAPMLVATGADLVAGRIRKLADAHGVPVIASPPLARSIYHHTKLGDEIPAGLYAAVAVVLGYAYRLAGRDGFESAPAPGQRLPIPTELSVDPMIASSR